MHLNLNDSSLSQQSVDLQTVDRLHVPDALAGNGDALNVHNTGLNSTVGLSSNTAGSTVDHSERQLLQQQQQHSTAQCHPLTQGGPVQISGGGDAVGVLQQHSNVQSRTDLIDHTDHGRQIVSGRPGVSAALDTTRQSEPAVPNSSRLMCAASGVVDGNG